MQQSPKSEHEKDPLEHSFDVVRSILAEKDKAIRELQEINQQLRLTIQSQEEVLSNFTKKNELLENQKEQLLRQLEQKGDQGILLSGVPDANNLVKKNSSPPVKIYVTGMLGDREIDVFPFFKKINQILKEDNVTLVRLKDHRPQKPFFVLDFYQQEPMAIPEDCIFDSWCTHSLDISGGNAVFLICKNIAWHTPDIERESLYKKSGVCLFDPDTTKHKLALIRLNIGSDWNAVKPEALDNIAKELLELARHFHNSTLDTNNSNAFKTTPC